MFRKGNCTSSSVCVLREKIKVQVADYREQKSASFHCVHLHQCHHFLTSAQDHGRQRQKCTQHSPESPLLSILSHQQPSLRHRSDYRHANSKFTLGAAGGQHKPHKPFILVYLNAPWEILQFNCISFKVTSTRSI